MALLADKYRPTQLSELDYHRDLANNLSELVNSGNFPHLLFYGPDGAGKSTRIRCILKELYGSAAACVRMEYRDFKTASGKKLELIVLSSLYHIEVTPSDVGIHDRIVVQELITHMAQSQQIDTQTQKSFKVIVIMEADTLSRDAQHALRRTMEKYAGSCKVIMCCNSVSKIIEPLRSRCMVIRVSAPSAEELKSCISRSAVSEDIEMSDRFLNAIAERSNGNLRRGLLLLECSANQYGKKLDSQKVIEPDWQCYIHDTAAIILKKCNMEGILIVRARFYELLTRCVPTYVIFEELLEALLPHCNATIRGHVIETATHFEHTCMLGSKDIYHLDAFVTTFMSIYRNQQVMGSH